MPELPEVETVVRGLEPFLLNNKIESIKLYRKDLRIPFPKNLEKILKDKKIISLYRRAKYILITFENNIVLVVHLGMSGRLSIIPMGEKFEISKHDHMVIKIKNCGHIIYNDPRRFGMVFTVNLDDLDTHKAFYHLGPEPFGNRFSAVYLKNVLKNKTCSIKQAIMDQEVVVGVGNIYASEALFLSKIDPKKQAGSISTKKLENLVVSIRQVLDKAIKAGGSTLKDYRRADGELGYFQHNFSVYNREGQPCPQCNCDISKTGGIQKITQSGRSTFYCSTKQK